MHNRYSFRQGAGCCWRMETQIKHGSLQRDNRRRRFHSSGGSYWRGASGQGSCEVLWICAGSIRQSSTPTAHKNGSHRSPARSQPSPTGGPFNDNALNGYGFSRDAIWNAKHGLWHARHAIWHARNAVRYARLQHGIRNAEAIDAVQFSG